VVRPETVRWFKEAMSNRLNNMDTSWIIAIMQRSHEADVAGTIIDDDLGYVHLNIPMEFEADNRCVTRLPELPNRVFWQDPRTKDGELMWSARFNAKAIAGIKKLGEHVWVGQYQQRPEPRGGGLFKRAYWQHYEVPTKGPRKGKFPEFEWILVSLDGAFTEKKQNDPQGCSVWGVFQNAEGSWCVMLLMAWRKWLTLNGTARPKPKTMSWADYKAETSDKWGVVQWARYECTRWKADELLIENKASGHDIFNEVVRQSEHDKWSPVMIDPKNLDKWARGMRVQPVFTEGLVYAITTKEYAKTAIDEMASFPRGKFDDITDSATQALWRLRKNGFLEHVDVARERQVRAQARAGKKTKPKSALYPS
jgi:predicted phage terminase large subunit-like protein